MGISSKLQNRANYIGISLKCHSRMIFTSIILQMIKMRTEEIILSEAQAGFRENRSTIDHISTLRQIAEEHEEYGKELFVCYIDFRKAFDSVWRKGLWRVMRQALRVSGKDSKNTRKCIQRYLQRCSGKW